MTEAYQLNGAMRARTPQETLKVIQPYIKKAGITRIADLTYLDYFGVPVYTCIRPNSKNISTSQGKGISDELAICSAYMEAIEQYYAESIISEQNATISALNKEFIDPHLFNRGFILINGIENIHFDWCTGRNLIDQKEYYVPVNYISLDFTQVDHNAGLFKRTSTGLASGNNYEEAVCHSLFEIIERNAQKEFEKLKLEEKNDLIIDLDSINSIHNRDLIEKIKSHDAELFIFDITHRFDVPTYHCIILDRGIFRNIGNHSGSGTHFNKEIALSRAITEACQSRATFIAGSRDDINLHLYHKKWTSPVINGNRNYQERQSLCYLTFEQQLDHLLNKFINFNYHNIITVQYTKNEDDICVVYCVVPGLII